MMTGNVIGKNNPTAQASAHASGSLPNKRTVNPIVIPAKRANKAIVNNVSINLPVARYDGHAIESSIWIAN